MLYQITAFDHLGALQLGVCTMETTDSGREWSHLVLELLDVPQSADGQPWDALWLIAQRISEVAIERGRPSS